MRRRKNSRYSFTDELTFAVTTVALFFTAPCAGWLPGRLVIGDTVVPLDISDVPNNAIKELFDALASAAAGRSGEVWLHEEPSGHLLTLQALDGDRVRLRVQRLRRPARLRACPYHWPAPRNSAAAVARAAPIHEFSARRE